MALANNTHTSSELHEFSSSESEVELIESGSDSDWDDLEGDPDFEETDCKFSNLSLTNKSRKSQARVDECEGLEDTEAEPKVTDITVNSIDDENFKKVEGIIKAGLLDKLKVEECKLYLRKNDLRLSGNKDILIQRIKEHQEIINGGGEKKYPPSSFVLNCKGDACVGDVVLFEQNVYEMFNIASRSASGPPCGIRVVAGRIVKESYGAAKQQHTFTIEVLWSKGEKPLSPLHPLLIKGRNLYRLKTLRQKWEDEGKRQNILMEKHSRGCVARAQREARIQEKEKRKPIRESHRVSKKDSVRNQKPTSHYHLQETDTSIKPEKPAFSSGNAVLPANTRKEMPPIANKPSVVNKQSGESIDSGRVSLAVHPMHNHRQPEKHSGHYGSTSDVNRMRKAELSSNYSYPNFHYREERTFSGKYHTFNQPQNCSDDYGRTSDVNHIRKAELSSNYSYPDFRYREERNFSGKFHTFNHRQPRHRSDDYESTSDFNLARKTELSSNYIYPDFHYREERTFSGKFHNFNHRQPRHRSDDYVSTSDVDHIRKAELSSNYVYPDFHYREERTFSGQYHTFNAETDKFTERTHHRQPLTSANHFPPLMNNREAYKQKQLCRHYARGWCNYGDNCKFLHVLN